MNADCTVGIHEDRRHRLRRKHVLLAVMLLFIAGNVLCALAPT